MLSIRTVVLLTASALQAIPSEELGPAAIHVQSKGFGVHANATSEIFSVVNDTAHTLNTVNPSIAATGSLITGSDTTAAKGTLSIDGPPESSNFSAGPRTYPAPKPHQGSGRQAEPLLRLRDELRKGVDR